jgi:peptide/nickel transport system permease protein
MVIAVSALIFFIIKLPPGDFLTTYIQQLELSGVQADQSTVMNLRRQYGLDKSDVEQYFIWVKNIVTKGDFGRSMQWSQPVSELIAERIGWTMVISFLILIVSYLVAIPVGIYAATHKYSVGDYIVTFIGFIGMAVPGFLLALVLVYLIFVNTGEVFVGLFSNEFLNVPWSAARFLNMLPRLGLVVGIIGLTNTAGTIRTMRAMTLDELEKQYVITARSKGLDENKMLMKYPIRMAINPICSTIGWALPGIISGEVVVSIVMNMPTIGPMLRRAFMVQDMYLAGSMMLFISVMTVVGTLLSDILLAIIDPRIRFGGVTE